MTNKPIVPCLWFDDQAEEAASFYASHLPGGRITSRSHYPRSGDNPSGKPPGSLLTVEFEIAGQAFTALNGGPQFTINPSISFFIHRDTAEEVDELFAALSQGGKVLMPLGPYPWSERFAWVQDRFGVTWQLMAERRREGQSAIVPCLMFVGAQNGKAEEAMKTYCKVFPGSDIDGIVHYERGEENEGAVMRARFHLAGHEFVAMDSHIEHGFAFNEAISFQVMCEDQEEIDRLWEALSEGGEKGPCGWLKDRFGLSWQIVPRSLIDWMSSQDEAAKARAFAAMLEMGKLDLEGLRAAYEGS